MSEEKPKSKRGFAAMSPEKRREIAQKGGKAVSQNTAHMTTIGIKGGVRSGSVRSRENKDNAKDTESGNG